MSACTFKYPKQRKQKEGKKKKKPLPMRIDFSRHFFPSNFRDAFRFLFGEILLGNLPVRTVQIISRAIRSRKGSLGRDISTTVRRKRDEREAATPVTHGAISTTSTTGGYVTFRTPSPESKTRSPPNRPIQMGYRLAACNRSSPPPSLALRTVGDFEISRSRAGPRRET